MTNSKSNTFSFKPSAGRILVEPDLIAEQTSFGILLPNNKEKPVTGTVIVGNKNVKKGDRILFSLFGLDEVKIGDKNYAIVSDSGILGKYA